MAKIIIDDTSNRMRKPNLWTLASTGVRSYGGSSTLFREVAGVGDTIKIDFHGTSITLHGMAPPAPAPTFDASINNKSIPEHTSQNAFVFPGSTGQWYTSPLLSSGTHSLSVGTLYGASIDYAVVEAGWDTPMMGERVVVDAAANLNGGGKGPLVFYAVQDGVVEEGAGWTRRAEQFVAADDPKTGWPYGNATMETDVVGAGARFRFTGTSLAIYGIFNYTTPGLLSVIYTIDAFPLTKTYAISPTSPEYTSGTLQRENTLLFTNDSLAPGDHTLMLEVTRAVNLSLVLDYLVYEAAFESVGVMPNLTVEAPDAGSVSLEGDADAAQGEGGSGRKPIAALVGGVLSGLVVMSVMMVLLLWWKRRRRSLGRKKHISSDLQLTPFSVDPTSPTSAATVRTQSRPGPTSVEPYILAASTTSPAFQKKLSMPVSLAPAAASHSPHPSTSSSPPPLLHGDVKHGGALVSTPPPHVAPPPRFSISNLHSPLPESADQEGRGGSGGGVFGTGRMQRLQELVLELDSEILEGGDGTARVAELRESIALLSREGLGSDGPGLSAGRYREWGEYGSGGDGEGSGHGRGSERRRGRARDTMGTLPPPYELRE